MGVGVVFLSTGNVSAPWALVDGDRSVKLIYVVICVPRVGVRETHFVIVSPKAVHGDEFWVD